MLLCTSQISPCAYSRNISALACRYYKFNLAEPMLRISDCSAWHIGWAQIRPTCNHSQTGLWGLQGSVTSGCIDVGSRRSCRYPFGSTA